MTELKRGLGFGTILCLSIASIMGSGMFFGAAIGAEISQDASLIAWLIISLVAVYMSTFFGELVALFPKAGGIYEFSKHAYNRFTSFLVGWIGWLVGNLTTSLLIIAAVNYILPDPAQLTLRVIVAITFILLLNVVAFYGVEASGIVVVVLSVLSIGLILSIIFPGVVVMDISNIGGIAAVGWLPIVVTVFFIAESFFGWESASYLAEETKSPEKTIPKAVLLGTIIVGALATTLAFVSLALIPGEVLITQLDAPLSLVFDKIYGAFGVFLNYGVFIALVGSASGGAVTMPRLLMALARDKLFIAQLADIHPVRKTPYKAIIFQTLVSILILFMALGDYRTLLSLVLPLGLIMYIFVMLIVPILRHKQPDLPRPFKVPFAGVGSFLVVTFLIGLIIAWILSEQAAALDAFYLGLSFIGIGIPIYLLLISYYDPDTIVRVNDFMAYFTLFTERFILPKGVISEILTLLGNVRNKTVLEFGCSVGTLTLKLAEHVKPGGQIFATDLSKQDLLITQRRVAKRGHQHVVVIHDTHQVNRVHPDVPEVDAIVSIGMMGYLQDVKKVLREMNQLLPHGGRIVFVDYADFFKVIPNVQWLSNDETIETIFREAGFSVFVSRKRGLFWNYVYVYGIKHQGDIAFV